MREVAHLPGVTGLVPAEEGARVVVFGGGLAGGQADEPVLVAVPLDPQLGVAVDLTEVVRVGAVVGGVQLAGEVSQFVRG